MIEKSKAILYHADISKRFFLVCHLKIVFNFLHELKQMSGDVTGWNSQPVDSDVTEGAITTRSNRMKFRLTRARKANKSIRRKELFYVLDTIFSADRKSKQMHQTSFKRYSGHELWKKVTHC